MTIKPVADILKEPGCPSNALPPHALEYVGDQGDRHKLMAWKKEVERIKDKIERDRDAYVARRRKELRAEAVKEGQAQTKVLAEVKKHAEARRKSSAALAKSSAALEQLRAKSAQLEEALKQKAVLASASDADPMVIKAKLELEKQLAKLEGRKLDDAKAMVERERAKEAAKAQREAQRKAEKAERDRVKEEERERESGEGGGARPRSRRRGKRRRMRFCASSARRSIRSTTRSSRRSSRRSRRRRASTRRRWGTSPSRRRRPWRTGRWSRTRQRSRIFFSVFAEALKAPKGMGTTKGLLAVISACGNDLANAYKAFMVPIFEIPATTPGIVPLEPVIGRGRNAAKWRRVMSDAAWPRDCPPHPREEEDGRGRRRRARRAAVAGALRGRARPGPPRPRRPRPGRRKAPAHHLQAPGRRRRAAHRRILEYNAEAARRRAVENKAGEAQGDSRGGGGEA